MYMCVVIACVVVEVVVVVVVVGCVHEKGVWARRASYRREAQSPSSDSWSGMLCWQSTSEHNLSHLSFLLKPEFLFEYQLKEKAV